MAIITQNGAVLVTAAAVPTTGVVWQNGCAFNAATGALYVAGGIPAVLAQSAIPFILAGGTGGAGTQFTISATGALSTLPTLPITSGNAFIYMPTATVPGLTGGWYYALIQSATTAQLYTATYTSGDPRLAVPASPQTPSGITAGSYSQTTATDISGPQFTLPAGSLGPNGSLYGEVSMTCPNSANTKGLRIKLSALVNVGYTDITTTPGATLTSRVNNRNSQSAQVHYVNSGIFGGIAQQNSAASYASVNTAVDQTVIALASLGNAAEFIVMERVRFLVEYGA